MSFPDHKYFRFGSTRTKAEAAADKASAEVDFLQEMNAPTKYNDEVLLEEESNKYDSSNYRLLGVRDSAELSDEVTD